ncbi:hypothetical protein M885DRAFT_528618 [Pelagophyceae sp. CCMP2097]|nr:hypothetical protein M885DRAFT_528618 [Pelagophyceae sp. CCMP2097]
MARRALAVVVLCAAPQASSLSAQPGLRARSGRLSPLGAAFEPLDGDFWGINAAFPGLREVHSDPKIYAVDDLLSQAECEALIAKAAPHLKQSSLDGGGEYGAEMKLRTSSDVRIEYDETPRLQGRFHELLNMPVQHFEPLKVSWYRGAESGAAGGHFSPHDDAAYWGYPQGCADCPTPQCNRVVTLIVYLSDCAEGGTTRFINLQDVDIQPKRGMGLLFFPALMNDSPHEDLRGRADPRVRHEGSPAVDEKYICQQWGWTGPIIREFLDDGYRAQGKCSDVIL